MLISKNRRASLKIHDSYKKVYILLHFFVRIIFIRITKYFTNHSETQICKVKEELMFIRFTVIFSHTVI